jgi:hypothetical protein
MKLPLLIGSCVLLVLGVVGSSALAAGPETCSSGSITGSHGSIVVTGNCTFSGPSATIHGNLTVANGAALNDHAASATLVTVDGNVVVGKGAILGLGYGPTEETTATVHGSIFANQPLTLYLGHVTVDGNVKSNGGGVLSTAAKDFRNFPIKDNTIHGNLILRGWRGGWLGVIRNTVDGNVTVSNNVSLSNPSGPGTDEDSTEVMGSVFGPQSIGGNLRCFNNTPPAHINPDDGGLPNTVAGKALGECADLVG